MMLRESMTAPPSVSRRLCTHTQEAAPNTKPAEPSAPERAWASPFWARWTPSRASSRPPFSKLRRDTGGPRGRGTKPGLAPGQEPVSRAPRAGAGRDRRVYYPPARRLTAAAFAHTEPLAGNGPEGSLGRRPGRRAAPTPRILMTATFPK